MNEFPENIVCLIAEGVIEERGNKRTVHGIFGGDEIIIQNFEGDLPLGLKTLVLLTRFLGVKSELKLKFEILDPENNPVADPINQSAKPNKMGSINHYATISPFVIKKFGYFTYKITINGKREHIYKFYVGNEPL